MGAGLLCGQPRTAWSPGYGPTGVRWSRFRTPHLRARLQGQAGEADAGPCPPGGEGRVLVRRRTELGGRSGRCLGGVRTTPPYSPAAPSTPGRPRPPANVDLRMDQRYFLAKGTSPWAGGAAYLRSLDSNLRLDYPIPALTSVDLQGTDRGIGAPTFDDPIASWRCDVVLDGPEDGIIIDQSFIRSGLDIIYT